MRLVLKGCSKLVVCALDIARRMETKTEKMMKTLHIIALTAVTMTVVGCKSTIDDRWRADLGTTLEQAHFRPVYEVQKDKGIVSGEASEE